jgi:tight adherence protein B
VVNVRRRLAAVVGTVGIVLLGGAPALAEGIVVDRIDTAGFPEVVIDATLTDAAAELAAAFPTAIEVRESGDLRADVTTLALDTTGIEVVVVVDRSGSNEIVRMQAVVDAVVRYLEVLPRSVPVALVSFDAGSRVDVPLTLDRDRLISVASGFFASGTTSLYDALVLARLSFSDEANRRIMVVVGDGIDNSSIRTLDDALVAVRDVEVEFIEVVNPDTATAPFALIADPRPVRRANDLAAIGPTLLGSIPQFPVRANVRYRSGAAFGEDVPVELAIGEFTAASGFASPAVPVVSSTTTPPTPTTEQPPLTLVPTTIPQIPVTSPGQAESTGTSPALVLGGLLLVGGVVLGVIVFTAPRAVSRRRLIPDELMPPEHTGWQVVTDAVDARLEATGRKRNLEIALDAAGISASPGTVLLGTTLPTFGGAALLWLIAGPLGGIVTLVALPLTARAYVQRRARKRIEAFISQLPDTLQTLGSMLRSGFGVLQAIDNLAREADDPTQEWLGRVVIEVAAGRDLISSLRALAVQVDSIDFDWVVAAIEISREVGGDLASTLDTVADTVRERDRLRGQIRALTAEGRLSAYVMLVLPPVVMVLSASANPEFASVLFEGIGLVMLAASGVLMFLGYLWMRKIIAKVA